MFKKSFFTIIFILLIVGTGRDLSLQQNNGIPTERAYTGQIQDASTTLQYYNARYYDPNLSRFISADQVQGGNRYAYVDFS